MAQARPSQLYFTVLHAGQVILNIDKERNVKLHMYWLVRSQMSSDTLNYCPYIYGRPTSHRF